MITYNVCGFHEVPLFAGANITDIVSIGDVGTLTPDLRAFPSRPTIERLEFSDLGHVCEEGPHKAHAEELIKIADRFLSRKEDVRVLYHCAAGISRSTAALFILLVRGGQTYQQAYDNILAVRGVLSPNILLIKYADILMNQGGKMLDFIASFGPEKQEWVKINGYTFSRPFAYSVSNDDDSLFPSFETALAYIKEKSESAFYGLRNYTIVAHCEDGSKIKRDFSSFTESCGANSEIISKIEQEIDETIVAHEARWAKIQASLAPGERHRGFSGECWIFKSDKPEWMKRRLAEYKLKWKDV